MKSLEELARETDQELVHKIEDLQNIVNFPGVEFWRRVVEEYQQITYEDGIDIVNNLHAYHKKIRGW